MSIYQFSAEFMDGKKVSLQDFEGKVLLIVNTATKCGFAPQLKELQHVYDTYKDRGLEVLGFPCNQFNNQEPGTDSEVEEACNLNFGVTFPLFKKVHVKGADAHPLYTYLTSKKKGVITAGIKWNFTKFLIDANGDVVKRYAPTTSPDHIEEEIVKLLK